jgi:hypothetical protein
MEIIMSSKTEYLRCLSEIKLPHFHLLESLIHRINGWTENSNFASSNFFPSRMETAPFIYRFHFKRSIKIDFLEMPTLSCEFHCLWKARDNDTAWWSMVILREIGQLSKSQLPISIKHILLVILCAGWLLAISSLYCFWRQIWRGIVIQVTELNFSPSKQIIVNFFPA